jgi:hypothetical protein
VPYRNPYTNRSTAISLKLLRMKSLRAYGFVLIIFRWRSLSGGESLRLAECGSDRCGDLK